MEDRNQQLQLVVDRLDRQYKTHVRSKFVEVLAEYNDVLWKPEEPGGKKFPNGGLEYAVKFR